MEFKRHFSILIDSFISGTDGSELNLTDPKITLFQYAGGGKMSFSELKSLSIVNCRINFLYTFNKRSETEKNIKFLLLTSVNLNRKIQLAS